jgi:hypothetical protein
MKRFAAHYLFTPPDKTFLMHYVELDNANRITGIFPLTNEIANTTFFNGILLLFNRKIFPVEFLRTLKNNSKQAPSLSIFQLLKNKNFPAVDINRAVFLYILEGIDLPTLRLNTNDIHNVLSIKYLN